MKINELVDGYVKLRDKKDRMVAEHKKALEPINKLMSQIEVKLLANLNEMGVESFRTDAGTAYKSVSTSATVADWDTFFDFVKEGGNWHMLEHRANKTAVVQYRDENGDIPPGLNWREEVEVNVRRS